MDHSRTRLDPINSLPLSLSLSIFVSGKRASYIAPNSERAHFREIDKEGSRDPSLFFSCVHRIPRTTGHPSRNQNERVENGSIVFRRWKFPREILLEKGGPSLSEKRYPFGENRNGGSKSIQDLSSLSDLFDRCPLPAVI